MKKLFIALGTGIFILISVLFTRTINFNAEKIQAPSAANIPINGEQAVSHLSDVLQFQTISHQDSTKFSGQEFHELHSYLEKAFPNVHASLKKETVNRFSLLYTWPGKDRNLKPILIMAHQDVVPVIPGTEDNWSYPPFKGAVAESHIWGRGALDDKASLMAILEAVETLLQNGFQPTRTIYLAFGHDEEIGGVKGAAKIAELLKSRNVHFEYVMDEGGLIAQGLIPGISKPAALVGIAEKGYVSLELSVLGAGGHSSMPPKNTAVGILCKAITKLEEYPFPANMTHSRRFFNIIGAEMPFFKKMVFANFWLFKPLIKNKLSQSPEMNATIRTTTAATMFNAGVKENVLPIKATAVVNFRIIPGEDVTRVINYVKKTIDDPRVNVKTLTFGSNPSPVSNFDSQDYHILEKTIRQVSDRADIIVAPYLVVGATDSRYFTGLSDNVFRFMFSKIGPADLNRVHGTNERISIANYTLAIKFYYQLIRNSNQL